MTDRDRLILEYPEKMCEYCCNFDKEYIGMDGTALCKLTMTLAYAEDYGGNCMFYNVPKEQIIVPPCKVGDTMYKVCTVNSRIKMGQLWDGNVVKTNCDRCGYRNCHCYDIGLRKHDPDTMIDVIVPKVIHSVEFLVKIMPYVGTVWFNTKEEAERALKECEKNV